MTAVEATPVEIWTEIAIQLLSDPALFRTNPFYPGCNLHTAFTEWYDSGPIERFNRQRGTLRLVSKSWKDLVDLRFDWIYTIETFDKSMLIESKWRSAKLIQLGVTSWPCTCVKSCAICTNHGHFSATWGEDEERAKSLLHDLCAIFSPLAVGPPLPMTKLVVAARIWETINKDMSPETIAHLLSHVQSLEIPDRVWKQLPSILPNLTHLSIGLGTKILGGSLAFPKLTTLKVRSHHGGSNFMESWILPQLLHLEFFNVSPHTFHFLERGWPSLISLRLISPTHPIILPHDLWSNLPHLEYFGSSALQGYHRTTLDHSLHTLGLLNVDDTHFPRRFMAGFIPFWLNLKVVADSHQWEEINGRGVRAASPKPRFSHSHEGPSCERCILDIGSVCEERGLRYEDRWGRTKEEFETDSVSHRRSNN